MFDHLFASDEFAVENLFVNLAIELLQFPVVGLEIHLGVVHDISRRCLKCFLLTSSIRPLVVKCMWITFQNTFLLHCQDTLWYTASLGGSDVLALQRLLIHIDRPF